MEVREATVEELPTVMTVFDGAMLATGADAVRASIDRGELLVAAAEGRVLGACLLAGEEIEAVAVRRARRDQGIGRALVEAAADRRERLVAEFDPRVRPFWASLGFEIEPAAESERYRGTRE
ncbi:GNAT family N-acetyltransferase [Halorientalis sp. IM1011]|uniref:GNAT family N-acetyltransferase n=1 Tax=Halorientalis sp. IM1011 TaxID=1932360 RepID=UPI00097CD4BB|nr:GNAT family N-acetyltransferase [Halorientalis sp. IM1011]AQL42969.1 GNAT family N-acetyltransferase [Halorientalis sp. IM1011]